MKKLFSGEPFMTRGGSAAIRHLFFGVVILLLSMLAVHSFLHLPGEWGLFHVDYDTLAREKDQRVSALLHGMQELKNRIYWSAAIMGLAGFVLLLLNTRKLRKLEAFNLEKKAALKLLEDRLAAMEACLEGIGIVDADGNLTYMNRALMELHAIKPHEAKLYIGGSWLNLYSYRGQEYVREHVTRELQKNGYWRGRSPIIRLDGTVRQVELAITMLPGGGFIGTARDVTEQLRTEQEKKDIQDQLYHAQKMEAIGRLAGGIAHDFNNILAAMNGYAEFLIEDLKDGSQEQGFAYNILRAGLQARSLVDGILAFSRRTDVEVEAFDLRTPLEECLSMLRASLPRTIEMRTDIANEDTPLEGNATRIAQAIMNLCVNARDAMEDEKGVLTVSLGKAGEKDAPETMFLREALDPKKPPIIRLEDLAPGQTRLIMGGLVRNRDYARLSIEDTGCGMSRIIMEHIFEPFFTTKPIDKGTGLGLPTVHGVVASHGGAMIIDSRLGAGTRFDLFLPMAASDRAAQGVVAAPERTPGGEGKILLVEDQDEVRRMTETMLVRLGYRVESAKTGLDALAILRRDGGVFDLVLTDQNMPKMTGLELAQQALLDYPDLRFVLISGYAQERLQDFMREQPAIRASLRKPVSQSALGRALEQVLGGR